MSTTPAPFEIHVIAQSDNDNAIDLLQAKSGLSKQRIKKAMQSGAVWHTRKDHSQRLRRAKRTLQPGDQIHLYYDERVINEVPPEPQLIADKGEYSVWHKPKGMRAQGSKWGDHCTIQRWAETHLMPERNSFTVHRLDLATNGLIIVAHSKKTAAAFGALFQNRHIEKQYRAVVLGDLSSHTTPLRIEEPIDGKYAVSEVSYLGRGAHQNTSLVNISIETGRKHQIRKHLSGIGHPVLGDRLYGGNENEDDIDLQLTAYLLRFTCPADGEEVGFQLPDALICGNPALSTT